jgi:hypothetical protein
VRKVSVVYREEGVRKVSIVIVIVCELVTISGKVRGKILKKKKKKRRSTDAVCETKETIFGLILEVPPGRSGGRAGMG